MKNNRVKLHQIVTNQLPEYVRVEYPLIGEFLKQYYISQEFQGAASDLIQNFDSYLRVDNQTNNIDFAELKNDISIIDDTIEVTHIDEATELDLGTYGFPDSYGLIQIDNEIITYEKRTETSFTGCIRGFSGITSFDAPNSLDELVFSTSSAENHIAGAKIINLSDLFLKEFFKKLKYQFLPGFEDRSLYESVNDALFLKQAKDFYQSKGTDESFKILFKALYGENVKIIKPKDQVISPSNAQYNITNDFIVEAIEGDPLVLTNQTLFQDEYQNISKAYAPITKVEEIYTNSNKRYYKLSIDGGYNRDIIVEGAIYGNFSIHAKSKLIGTVNENSTVLTVDSTVGFPNQGELFVVYNDSTTGIISYSSKTLNQFLECSGINGIILDNSDISINTYAYANVNDQQIRVRINSVLSGVKLESDSFYNQKGEIIQIQTLGTSSEDVTSKSWILNVSGNYQVHEISVQDLNNRIYQVSFEDSHHFRVNDLVSIIDSNLVSKNGSVLNVVSNKTIQIRSDEQLNINTTYQIQRNLSKVNSSSYSYLSELITDVQNVYKNTNKTLIASPSIPFYGNQSLETFNHSIIFSLSGIGTDTFQITSTSDHGFYTGDLIYYTPEKNNGQVISALFSEGIYYVKRVDANNIKFAKSASDIQNQIFINTQDAFNVSLNKIELYQFKSKNIETQRLLREISDVEYDGQVYSTPVGFTGMLVNGVEILNYKSSDRVYYGNLEEILVTSSGQDYDVVNPPVLNISDLTGTGASAICSVEGSLQEIRILNAGYDYIDTPIIRITGGNGIGAKASAVLKSIQNEVQFNAESTTFVNLSTSTIGFSTYHRFRNAEKVIYNSNSQQAIGGLTTASSYYVSTKNEYTIAFHQKESDALSGINTISLTSYGKGTQSILSFNKKSVLGSINIENSGFKYTNQIKTTTSSGINTSLNVIRIQNHEFEDGEVVKYTSNETPIGGLTSGNLYIITKVNDREFKLSENQDIYYQTKQYINFTTGGTGTHVFNYPEIQVEILGRVGISSVSSTDFSAKIQPIFRGKIKSVHLTNGGTNYGSSDILNYDKQPTFNLNSGGGAQLTPVISNGRIIDILINNPGNNYNSPPNLTVIGTGLGAILTPVIVNGQVRSVKIVEGGIDYSSDSTKILVSSAGKGAAFRAKIQQWTVNTFVKEFNNLHSDDGTLCNGINENFGIQYSHLYAPRNLRSILYTKNRTGEDIFSQSDLANDSLSTNLQHSPIIGWAYDGNPIYGPYGYNKKSGGSVVQLKSGYVPVSLSNRPNFPNGFFVEDYVHKSVDDETVLDEHNGRFCITPDFPNGTYAYFSTFEAIQDSIETNSPFIGFKRPKFPFLIGNTYSAKPNNFNFIPASNQDQIDLNQTNWIRNTYAYNLLRKSSNYSYLNIPNNLKQVAKINFATSGSVENVDVSFGGSDYKIDDQIVFDSGDVFAKVSKIEGKSVSSISAATTSLYEVEFYSNYSNILAICPSPHNLSNLDSINISGINTTTSLLEGSHVINVSSNTISLASSLSSSVATGIVTYFDISSYSNINDIKENDIYKIGTEEIKVLNVDSTSSRIRVLRGVNSTVGSAHSISEVLIEKSRKFSIPNSRLNLQSSYEINREYYFNPLETLSIGTVGSGTTIIFSNPGAGTTQIFAPLRSVYFPNHKLNTGDTLKYSFNGGSPIQYSTTGSDIGSLTNNSLVYVGRISNDFIGISTVPIGIGSTGTFVGIASTQRSQSLIYFVGIGTGEYHSFKTQYSPVKGKVNKNKITVITSEAHNLQNNDTVDISVISGISTTVAVKYDDYNRRMTINARSFSSGNINLTNNTIEIINHRFAPGQKLIYTSSSPSGGLINNQIYYAVVLDENTIRLSDSYYNATKLIPNIIDITSASTGTLAPINPLIIAHKNSKIIFDVSDSSLGYTYQATNYSAFSLDFYEDENFVKKFEGTRQYTVFEITKSGTIGVSNDAKVTLSINDSVPEKLYYKLNPVYNSPGLPTEKSEIVLDSEVNEHNRIEIRPSLYDGTTQISVASSTSFTYSSIYVPELSQYNTSNAILSYQTNSRFASGAIANVDVFSSLNNFKVLPGISSVITSNGYGSILDNSSTSIGKIQKTTLSDIGYDFPSDFTLRPTASTPQIIEVDRFSSFERIDVTSFGRGYNSAPVLVILDGKTDTIVSDIDIRYTLGETQVKIYKNTDGINDVTPRIVPTQNTNGVGISSVSYNQGTKTVTLTLSSEFSTLSDFPFEIGDKILVENITVDANIGGTGYNSSDYNYKLFTITNTIPNIGGGNGSISYSLDNIISSGSNPGVVDQINSVGRVIPEKYFPTFSIKLRKNNFIIGEKVISNNNEGYVLNWNENTKQLSVTSRFPFNVDSIIQGTTSYSKGLIKKISTSLGYFEIAPYSRIENGWKTEVGFLNNDLQRIQDSDYYQAFSYSIKSRVDYNTWNDVVSSLNHTAGFKKFADYEIESSSTTGISTYVSNCDVTNDLIGFGDLNCIHDFDLVSENYLTLNNLSASDEIVFSSKILTSYYESIGNRVLKIDDISSQFDHYSQNKNYVEISNFSIDDIQAQKHFVFVRDRRYTSENHFSIITLIHNHQTGYLNQYGTLNSNYEMGYYDFDIESDSGILKFYPTKYKVNDFNVTTVSYNIRNNVSGVGTTSFNDIVKIQSSNIQIINNSSGTIVGISSSITSAKILVEVSLDDSHYEFDEISMIHDGTNIQLSEYGQLVTNNLNQSPNSGFGTYYAYYSGSNVNIDFIPHSGIGTTTIVNTIQIGLANTGASGTSNYDLKNLLMEARTTSIASSTSPSSNIVSYYNSDYTSAYFIIQVSDITNNIHQLSEMVVMNTENDAFYIEFGNISTDNFGEFIGIGTFNVNRSTNTELIFTPKSNIDVKVNVFMTALKYQDDLEDLVNFQNATIQTNATVYYGTKINVNRTFELKHKNLPIFQRTFDGSSSSIVNLIDDTIFIPQHYFVTGEPLIYSNSGNTSASSIGIATTSFTGIGVTDRLPMNVYAVKVNDSLIKLARSVDEALGTVPKTLNFTSVGNGSFHKLTSTDQNSKALIAIDNVIQSPITSNLTSYQLSTNTYTTDEILYFTGITSFFSGDLVKVNNEIMRIESVGIGSTNGIRVIRSWLGTPVGYHTATTPIYKVTGNYNIVNNTLNFVDAPYGIVPQEGQNPNEMDWSGITTSSSFNGRVFLRSGVSDTSNETYYNNHIFDDISNEFNSIQNSFILKSNNSNLTGFYQNNGIILINDVFQTPGSNQNYTMAEGITDTTLTFSGNSVPVTYDVGISTFPKGGMIVSVSSSEGFGYQPLISAGGTAIISGVGTVQSISIGNSGSGYRSGLQIVNVGVTTITTGTPKIEFIGTATVSNGHVVSVAITNPGIGYTTSNPPIVVFDDPLPYSNIPLIYSSKSSGIGTNATVNVVVGQGSSIIDFEIKNIGQGYKENQILTIPITGIVGIPTNSSPNFSEFNLNVDRVASDKFSGWTFGNLELIDDVSSLFNGRRISFPIRLNGELISIYANKGSNVSIQDTLIIFVNGILQVPGESYYFNGGSIITFTEAPKEGDIMRILFYKGTDPIDVLFKDILETVKPGDELTIGYDSSIGQSSYLQENKRTVSEIKSLDTVKTLPYFGPGNVDDFNILRPVVWCRQTEDKIINENPISKTRALYEASVTPVSYMIQSLGIGSTVVWVDSVRPLFNSINESNNLDFQKNIEIISQNDNNPSFEHSAVTNFSGDHGIIVGLGTTTVGVASTALYFDLFIPLDSSLRNSSITGVTTISSIQIGHYFSVYDSNNGNGIISLNTNESTIGIGTTFLDNVYQVAEVVSKNINIIGIGTTTVSRVSVKVSNYNNLNIISNQNYYGRYSWGKLTLTYRKKNNQYNAYPVGISTGDIIARSVALKSSNYTS